jgi:hypothetical protein
MVRGWRLPRLWTKATISLGEQDYENKVKHLAPSTTMLKSKEERS